jgi:hypothetical protein
MTRLTTSNGIFVFATALMAAAPAGADDAYKISGGEVTVMCPLRVGGSFEAKTKNLGGDVSPVADRQGAVRGSLRVELQTLETGIGIRDRHMKNNYLEVEKGPAFATATIEDTTYLGVGVRDEIQIKVSLMAVPAGSQPVATTGVK